MAAETLGRRAFGHHPQFWRVWSKAPGSSTTILGQTAAGYLLVAVFFAYDVALYVIATRRLWLVDALRGAAPPRRPRDLRAMALGHRQLAAGRVLGRVPVSRRAARGRGAHRRSLRQAGPVPRPSRSSSRQSSSAPATRPIPRSRRSRGRSSSSSRRSGSACSTSTSACSPASSCTSRSTSCGSRLPIFLSDAPGIWLQKVMVIVMTFVPLWVVLWRRRQAGAWTTLAPAERNAAWTPPSAPEPEEAAPVIVHQGLTATDEERVAGDRCRESRGVYLGHHAQDRRDMFSISRSEAATIARQAVAARGAPWSTVARDADRRSRERRPARVRRRSHPATTGGEQLLGKYLPDARWNVRVATYEGDVAERAEEWRVFVTRTGQVLRVEHTLPEARPGATLDESSARTRAAAVLKGEFGLDVASGQAREISARPAKRKARTDWTFTYADSSLPPLTQGELRIDVELAGDELASVRRFVFVPEAWERGQRAAETRSLIVRIIIGIVFGGLLVSAAVGGVVAWSRRSTRHGCSLPPPRSCSSSPWRRRSTRGRRRRRSCRPRFHSRSRLLGAIGVGLVALVDHLEPRGPRTRRAAGADDRLEHAPRPRRVAPRRRRRRLRCGTPRRWQARCGRPSGPKPSTSPRWDRSCRRWPWRSIRSPAF